MKLSLQTFFPTLSPGRPLPRIRLQRLKTRGQPWPDTPPHTYTPEVDSEEIQETGPASLSLLNEMLDRIQTMNIRMTRPRPMLGYFLRQAIGNFASQPPRT